MKKQPDIAKVNIRLFLFGFLRFSLLLFSPE